MIDNSIWYHISHSICYFEDKLLMYWVRGRCVYLWNTPSTLAFQHKRTANWITYSKTAWTFTKQTWIWTPIWYTVQWHFKSLWNNNRKWNYKRERLQTRMCRFMVVKLMKTTRCASLKQTLFKHKYLKNKRRMSCHVKSCHCLNVS